MKIPCKSIWKNRWKVKIKIKIKIKNWLVYLKKKNIYIYIYILLFHIQQCPRTFTLYSHFSYYVQNGDILQ